MSPPPETDQPNDHWLAKKAGTLPDLLGSGVRVFCCLSPPESANLSPNQYTNVIILVTCEGSQLGKLSRITSLLKENFNPDWISPGLCNLTEETRVGFAETNPQIELPQIMRPGQGEVMYIIRGDFPNSPELFQEVLAQKRLSDVHFER